MNWTPIYLRAADEATMLSALTAAGLTDTDDENNAVIQAVSDCCQVVVLGVLSAPTGEIIDDVPQYAPVPGWHVNVITNDETLPDKLASVTIKPKSPTVQWAGQTTGETA